jgi:hypothetical protein
MVWRRRALGSPDPAPRLRAPRLRAPHPPQAVPIKQREVLEYVGEVEEAMVAGLTFKVPQEYADRPILQARGRGGGQKGGASTLAPGLVVRRSCSPLSERCALGCSVSTDAALGAVTPPSHVAPRTCSALSLPSTHCTPSPPAPPLPQGRATLEMKVDIRETPEGPQSPVLTIVLDGYNAPVSAGQVGPGLGGGACRASSQAEGQRPAPRLVWPCTRCLPQVRRPPSRPPQFLDLVQRGFYDKMEIQRADGFVVQTGDPDGPGPQTGFVDPATGKLRL